MNADITNNQGFYSNLDINFEIACDMCDKKFSHEELLSLLLNGNIPQKQIAALKFDYVNSYDDAKILLKNLVGCDGKIREAVALKINTLLISQPSSSEYFAEIAAEVFANATIDINANICRLIVDSTAMLKKYDDFSSKYTEVIVQHAVNALEELDKFIFRDKKYTINKQIFKLYWCLEALSIFYLHAEKSVLQFILEKSSVQSEYTIREKVAKIISSSNEYDVIKNRLINDENYYVRQMLRH